MKKQPLNPLLLFGRYLLILLIVLFASFSSKFYEVMLVLTIYPVNWILSIFYTSAVYSNFIFLENISLEIIPACVAVSAYILLLILNFLTQMNLKKRFYSIFFSMTLLLFLNIIRIVFLAVLLVNEYAYFDAVHKFVWYFMSLVIVVGIWFLTAYLFKIKNIPFFTDIKSLLNNYKK
jgi:exosortase/archaeosortase family protein